MINLAMIYRKMRRGMGFARIPRRNSVFPHYIDFIIRLQICGYFGAGGGIFFLRNPITFKWGVYAPVCSTCRQAPMAKIDAVGL